MMGAHMRLPDTEDVPVSDVAEEETSMWGIRTGWVTGLDAEGHLWVDFAGNPSGPLRANRTVPLEGPALREAVTSRQGVALSFDRGRRSHPIVLGLIQAP